MSPSVSLCLLQTQSDARLVELARSGHERAFEALVQRYRKPLLGYCRRLLLTEARAEDALQQGLLQAWLALRDGGEVHDAKAWLYRIMHNAAISARRRSGYDYVELNESLHGQRAPESDIDRRIAVREALAGLAALPRAQREALLLTAIQGHSHEQVAVAMGVSDGAVRGLIYRARATLRTAVTALTPPQLALWAARSAERGSAHTQLAEIAGGGGSAGAVGALLKGGAVVVSAGVLATGATVVQHRTRAGSNVQTATRAGVGHHRALPEAAVGDPHVAAKSILSVPAQSTVAADPRRRGDRRDPRGRRSEPGGPDPGVSGDTDRSGGDRRSLGGGGGSGGGLGPSSPGGEGSGDGHASGGDATGGPSDRPSSSGSDGGDRGGGESSGGGSGGPGQSPPVPPDVESVSSATDSGSDAGSNGARDGSPTAEHGDGSSSNGSGKSEE